MSRSDKPAQGAGTQKADAVILFDGVCNLCNGAVLFILDRDAGRRFAFASLQSPAAVDLLRSCGRPPGDVSSILLLESGSCYSRSAAALRIARRLTGGWPLLYVFILVPRPIRDVVYNFIARHRYAWFGRTEACRIPTPETAARFLPGGSV